MDRTPTISVILCTYNNAVSLARTLDQIMQCTVDDPAEVEVLVVDNNSDDHTAAVVRDRQGRSNLSLTYCFEEYQGLSKARNHGVNEARGTYLLFTDDDADIPPHWIARYLDEIQLTEADCLFSKIAICWDRSPPWWFDHRYNPFFVQLDYGNRPLNVTDRHHEFFGKNFCCRKSVIETLGGFDERLGRNGTSLAAGEETIIYRRLVDMGARVTYFPDASVGHRLKPDEYTTGNIEKKFVDGAGSSLRIAASFPSRRLFGRPAYPLKSALVLIVTSILRLPVALMGQGDKSKRDAFYHRLQIKRSIRLIRLWVAA